MNEEAVIISIDIIRKQIQRGALPVALDHLDELENNLQRIINKAKGVVQIPMIPPAADVKDIIPIINQLIAEQNRKLRK